MAEEAHGQDGTPTSCRMRIPLVVSPDLQEDRLHILLWQVRGETDLIVEDESHCLTAGYALWIPVGVRHRFTVKTDSVTMPLAFDVGDTTTILRAPTLVAVDRDLRTLMLAYTVSRNSVIKPEADLAQQILSLIEDRPFISIALPIPTSEPAQIIAEALRSDPGDVRTVEELAESVHTSTRTIERAFRAETGMTLRRWRIRNRVEAAAVLLRSRSTLEAVAHRIGYTNVNSFRRVFTTHVGISPTEYVKRYRAH